MLIIGLNGSPNKEGNTRYLIDRVLTKVSEQGAQTKVLNIVELLSSVAQPFCMGCSGVCTGGCYKDTELEQGMELLKQADGILLGSPSYFGTISGQLKAFFDKTRKIRTEKAFYNKVAAGITVGGSKYGGQETTLKALHDIMLVHGMIVIGDGYIEHDCGHQGVCGHSPSKNDEFAINRADILAKRMFEVCSSTKEIRRS